MAQEKDKIIKDTFEEIEKRIVFYSEKTLQSLVYVKDKELFVLAKRCEKIATAFHMIADILPDQEFALAGRSSALQVITAAYRTRAQDDQSQDHVIFCLEALVSLVTIGATTGRISHMNAMILDQEMRDIIRSYAAFFKKRRDQFLGEKNEQAVLPSRLFTTSTSGVLDSDLARNFIKDNTKGQSIIKDIVKDKSLKIPEISASISPVIKNEPLKKPKESQLPHGRRWQILELFQHNKEMSINGIAEAIPGWSTKTIQRELSQLVEEKILYKKGERRWSTYILIDEHAVYRGHLR